MSKHQETPKEAKLGIVLQAQLDKKMKPEGITRLKIPNQEFVFIVGDASSYARIDYISPQQLRNAIRIERRYSVNRKLRLSESEFAEASHFGFTLVSIVWRWRVAGNRLDAHPELQPLSAIQPNAL